MSIDLKLTIGYDELIMPCQGCKELSSRLGFKINLALSSIYLIVSEIEVGNDEDKKISTSFYCKNCAVNTLESLKSKLYIGRYNVFLPKDRKIVYQFSNEEWERYTDWEIMRRKIKNG